MKLLEHEAKTILTKYSLPTPQSVLLTTADSLDIQLPVVLKSQVPAGGRGKAGGVVIVQNHDELKETVNHIFNLEIKGHLPHSILAEELLEITNELYLSLILDMSNAEIVLMAHKNGGVDVEENTQDDFLKIPLISQDYSVYGLQLSEYFNIPEQAFVLEEMIKKLKQAFIEQDATLLEINPLVYTRNNRLVIGDCKMELDDAASFRHPEWDFEASKTEVNFVTLNPQGTVATIANGAGLAMATVDAVSRTGLTPANFLDIGGGANEASVLAAFTRISEYEKVEAIIINIFAGITRCDEVARAIISAKNSLPNLPKLYIRLEGTNFDIAEQLLRATSIDLFVSLEVALSELEKDMR